MTSTNSLGDSSSFKSDEDGGELGHLSVSASELNQLRQHVIAMRKNMNQKNKHNMAPAADNVSVLSALEDVDISGTNKSNQLGSTSMGAAGLIAEDHKTPEEKKRLFRLSVVSNIFFMLGAILYVCVAHGDLQWAKDIQGIPINVLTADDDATWTAFQKSKAASATTNPPGARARARALEGGMRMDEDQDYNEMLWADLQPDIQLALMVLGHNQRTWDLGMTSSAEEQPWNKLTVEQQDAAEIIGYTAQEWDEEEEEMELLWEETQEAYFDTDADDDQVDDQAPMDDQFDDAVAYNDQVDDQAPMDDQLDDAVAYDDQVDDQAPMDDQLDDAVEYDDQVYGTTYDDQVVDDTYPADDDQVDDAVDDAVAGDVTAEDVFGWYEGQHDDYYPEGSETQEPTTSAPQYTVDGAAIPVTSTPGATASVTRPPQSPADLMVWGDYGWEDLPAKYQMAFEILGYNEELWTTGGSALTEELYWGGLTPAQQEQAAVLGFNQALWNLAQDGDYGSFTGRKTVAPKTVVGTDPGRTGDQHAQGDDYPVVDANQVASDSASGIGDDEYMNVGDVVIETNAVLLLFAAMSFMIVGIMSWLRERQVFHIWMVQGGVWGILSALTMDFSSFASLLLQTVSVHCFLLEAFFTLRVRLTMRFVKGLERLSYVMLVADVLYALGAIIHVVLVYILHANGDAYYDVGPAYGEVFAGWCWFIASTAYSYNTMALANKSNQDDAATPSLSIQRRHPNGDVYTIRPAAIQLRNSGTSTGDSDSAVLT